MKLLNRTIQNYIIFSILLVLCSTPLFYYSIQHLVVTQMDKVLQSHKEDFEESLSHLKTEKDLAFFTFFNKEFLLVPTSSQHVKDSLYTIDVYDSIQQEEVPHRVYRTGVKIENHWYELYITESMVSNLSLISSILLVELIMLSVLLAGLYIINSKLSKIIWEPFYDILAQLRNFNLEEDNDIHIPVSKTAEFRQLGKAIKELVKKNHAMFQSQKEFTENASHELQTPLAICRNKLELLAQAKDLTKEQADLIESLLEATERIARINRNLLLLSKIENRQFLDKEEVKVNILLSKIVELYQEQATERSIHIKQTIEPFTLHCNPALLEILFSNLISNAIRHSAEGVEMQIHLTDNHFKISNEGSPLDDPDKIFERFKKNTNHKSFGNGLGLSIVRKICDVNDYHLKYHFKQSRHIFTVKFA